MTKHFLSALVCVAMIMAGCTMQRQQEQVSMDYPRAEWDRAGVILMHTPGQELFDGVIHPSAGLFEHYFDVDKAAEEHRTYIRLLEANGIQVYTVTEILNEVSVDTLRMLADHELTYDLSAMPDADKADAEAYRQEILSQMSRSDLIRCILLRPVVRLFPDNNNTGVDAEYVHDPLMNLYFTRDQSITTPRGHIICRMNSPQRAVETSVIDLCYRHLGLTPVLHIEGEGRLEGGDYIPAGTVAFIGCGMRTNEEGIRQIMEADAFGHDTIVVVHDHKRWQMQMHLDTHFNIIDRDLCTMVSSRLNAKPGEPEFNTCDIYAREPGTKPYNLMEMDMPFVEYLQIKGFEIIPIDHEDEMHYANNYLTIAPRHIMAVAGQSKAYQQRLADAGVTVEWIPLESLIDGYGAAHCMTQVLKRYNRPAETFIPAPPDYQDTTMWITLDGDTAGTGADIFYVVSTWEQDWMHDSLVCHYADVWNPDHRARMAIEIRRAAAYMSPGNRFYAPFYRHTTIDGWVTRNEDTIYHRTRLSMDDVCRAFDMFVAQRDKSRPLVIAGFSQGGMAVVELLKHMSDETFNQLVAAYVMGYKLTPQDTLCPHIRPAQGELDTHVTICYNTVKDVRFIQPVIAASCVCINPVNWRTDATPATLHDTISVTVAPEHVLVVSGYSGSEYPPYAGFINVGDIHSCEPWLYSDCIRRNIQKRTQSFSSSIE